MSAQADEEDRAREHLAKWSAGTSRRQINMLVAFAATIRAEAEAKGRREAFTRVIDWHNQESRLLFSFLSGEDDDDTKVDFRRKAYFHVASAADIHRMRGEQP